MKSREPEQLLKNLRDIGVELPNHKKALRRKLLAMQASGLPEDRLWLRHRLAAQAGALLGTRRVLPIGLFLAALVVLLFGVLVANSGGPGNSSKQLVAAAAPAERPNDSSKGSNITEPDEALNTHPQQDAGNASAPAASLKRVQSEPDLLAQSSTAPSQQSGKTVVVVVSSEEPKVVVKVNTDKALKKALQNEKKEEKKENKQAAKDERADAKAEDKESKDKTLVSELGVAAEL